MAALQNPVIPPGAKVLVTGANGYLASHAADQFLRFGYKVRGTVRDAQKSAWMVEHFEKEFGTGSFELVQVVDMATDGAFDEAVQGVSAVIHTASIMGLQADPDQIVPGAVAGATNALKAALGESGVKRFVFTSSSAAMVTATPGVPGITLSESTWNTRSIELAYAPGAATNPANVEHTYSASKTRAEQEVWKLYEENRGKRPDLVVNTVLPNFNFGSIISPEHQGSPSSSSLITSLWNNQKNPLHGLLAPQYYVDVQDVGKLHVAAAISPSVEGQRIIAFADRFSFDKILDMMRKIESQRTLPDNFSGGEDPNEVHPEARARAEALLRELGSSGFTSMETSIKNNIAHISS